MIVKFLEGWLKPERSIIPGCVESWIAKADAAKKEGCELVVFKLPVFKNQKDSAIAAIEKLLQEKYMEKNLTAPLNIDTKKAPGCVVFFYLLALCVLGVNLCSCNLVKKTTSSSSQTTDSSRLQKIDSATVRTNSSSNTTDESWFKIYSLLQSGQNHAPEGKTVYVPGQPYLVAEGGSKSSSSNQSSTDSTRLQKIDSSAIYRQALSEEKQKSRSSFPWYWFVLGGLVLVALGFFLPQYSIVKK